MYSHILTHKSMTKLITLTFILLLSNFIALTAQNLLDDKVFGFESPSTWYIQSKEYWTISKENVYEGNFAAKYNCSDFTNIDGNIQMHCGGKSTAPDSEKVILTAGTYKVTVRVWIGTTYPKSFSVKFKATETSPFVSVIWKLYAAPKEQWLELAEKIIIKEAVNAQMIVGVSHNARFGGEGIFYLDNIRIEQM